MEHGTEPFHGTVKTRNGGIWLFDVACRPYLLNEGFSGYVLGTRHREYEPTLSCDVQQFVESLVRNIAGQQIWF